MLMLLFLVWQQSGIVEPESVNARIFYDGNAMDLIDVKVKGVEPYTIEMRIDGETTLVNLYRISRIQRKPDSREFEVLFTDGEVKDVRISPIAFSGNPDSKTGKREAYLLHNLKRIHFMQGNQLRACLQGHYEHYTPYPYCPVCGNELVLGPYPEDLPEQPPTLPTHRLRLDTRDPSSVGRTTTSRRNQ